MAMKKISQIGLLPIKVLIILIVFDIAAILSKLSIKMPMYSSRVRLELEAITPRYPFIEVNYGSF
jgi:hypothetical protein